MPQRSRAKHVTTSVRRIREQTPPCCQRRVSRRERDQKFLPMCLQIRPTSFPFPSWVTRRLQSQCPPLNSSRPSLDTTRTRALISTPGENGPFKNRCVLRRETQRVEIKASSNQEIGPSLNVHWIYNQHIKLSGIYKLKTHRQGSNA